MDDLIERAVKEHLKNDALTKERAKDKEQKLKELKKAPIKKEIIIKNDIIKQPSKKMKKSNKYDNKTKKTTKDTDEGKYKENEIKEYIEYAAELNSNIQKLISVLTDALEHMNLDNTAQKQLNEINKTVKQCLDENQKIAGGVLKVVEMVQEMKEEAPRPHIPAPEEFPSLPSHVYVEPPKGMHEIEQPITPQFSPQEFSGQIKDLRNREGRIPVDEMEQLRERTPSITQTAQYPQEKPLSIPIPMHKAPPSEFRQFKEKVKKLF